MNSKIYITDKQSYKDIIICDKCKKDHITSFFYNKCYCCKEDLCNNCVRFHKDIIYLKNTDFKEQIEAPLCDDCIKLFENQFKFTVF